MADDNEVVDSGGSDAGGFDMEAGVNEISEGLGFGSADADTESKDGLDLDAAAETDETEDTQNGATDASTDSEESAAATAARAVPKSWAKEQHERWAKIDPQTQEYIELREKQMLDGIEQYKGDASYGKQMRDVTEPYKAFITSQGVDAPKAVQYLLNAHYRLSTAQPQDRAQYFAHMAKSYGIDLSSLPSSEATEQVDPAVKALREELSGIKTTLSQEQNAKAAEARQKIASEVETFAKDPKNQYFDECSEDIVALIQAGHTLQDAYEKAVYANPVTRAKELARLQAENEKALRTKSKAEAEAARKAAGTNVRSRDTRRAPTEPKGSMDDTMRSTLAEIRGRTH